ncbi:MAG: N-acyl homoserine lactonase family protein [Armatimonadetes bacterium]|nr:N-acyl homoserine lactonase family protein [Armatimonadota bacterium]
MAKLVIHPLLNGRCVIPGNVAFYKGDPQESWPYALYSWLILGADKPILVDTGLENVDEMNRGAAHIFRELITQEPEDDVGRRLGQFGLTEADIGALIITHLHFDHVDCLDRFTNAHLFVSGRGLRESLGEPSWAPAKTQKILTDTAKDRTTAEDDIEVAPGIRTMWIGGHTPCSQAVLVDTAAGRVCMTGDTVSLLENIESGRAVGVYSDVDQCFQAMERIPKECDIVLPSHDPGTLERFPKGVGA